VSVLIVEDSWHIATAVQSLLEDAGMVIAGAAATTTDAERLASEGSAKLAVVDVKLQDGMAFDLIDHLHDLGVSVVVVSGFSSFSTPLGRTAAVLQKPFAGQELLGALARVLIADQSGHVPKSSQWRSIRASRSN
jgi:DNA-binding response OmpR family regulator